MTKNAKKNNLDEMQEQKMLKLEECGFWILFFALAAAILVQLLMGGTIRQIAGEAIVLLIGSAFYAFSSLRNGLWTRNAVPTRKGNVSAAIIAALLVGVLNMVKLLKKPDAGTNDILIAAAFVAAAFVICYIVLELFRFVYQNRRAKLDDVDEKTEG
ncbi:MAG: hypothetical protein J5841_05965 [Clostridia bacterium]|nr:hypothetical protein [Clostridia bacterium]